MERVISFLVSVGLLWTLSETIHGTTAYAATGQPAMPAHHDSSPEGSPVLSTDEICMDYENSNSDFKDKAASDQDKMLFPEPRGKLIYVAKIDGISKYCQDTWPDENIGLNGDIEDALFAAGENGTVIVSGGSTGETYTEGDLDTSDCQIDTQADNQTLRGALPSDDPSGMHTGPVTLVSKSNNVVCNQGKMGFFLKDLNISGGSVPSNNYGILDEGQTNTENVVLSNLGSGLAVQSLHSVTHERLVVKLCQNTVGSSVLFDTPITGNFYYCLFEGNKSLHALTAKNGNLQLYNCAFIGNKRHAVYVTGFNNPDITVKNSVFAANVNDLADAHVIDNNASNGTICVSNSALLPHPTKPSTYFLKGVNLTVPDNNVYLLPQFKAGRRPAIIVVGVDDSMNFEYFKNLADECAERGFRAVFFANTGSFFKWSELQVYVDEGHEVASHTRWHSDMTSLDGICIRYVGSGQTCALNISNNVLITSVGGGPGGENLNIDLLDEEFDSLPKLVARIDEYASYSCFWENPLGYTLGSATRSKCLADVSWKDIKTSFYSCQLDPTRFYDEELVNSKADIEGNLSNYVCKAFAPPGNRTDESLEEALKAREYLGARGSGSSSEYLLEDIRVYAIKQHLVRPLLGSSDSEIRLNAAAFCEFLNYVGGIYVLYAHSALEFSVDQWEVFLDVVAQSNVSVMTFSEAIEHIRNLKTGFLPPGTDADGDQERWTRDFFDASDYTLNSKSPLIGAGIDVGLTHDFAGTPVPQGHNPDIGLFEYKPNYVYKPLIYNSVMPCRVVDTRISQGGAGPIIGGTQRDFSVVGMCNVPSGAAKAVMINIAATNAAGMGNLRAFSYPKPVPFAAFLNYGIIPGLNAISNAGIIPVCDTDEYACPVDLSIWVSTTTDVVVDIMGYFSCP